MMCYIEAPFIDNDVLYRGVLNIVLYRGKTMMCYIEASFIDNDVLYRGTLYRQ